MVSPMPEMKHVACARCRDRKVKCDGGKPGCKRCQRNGTPCCYVRGKKQQTRSEWVQHLRTFSSQPGRPDVTRSLSRPSSQPALPRTPPLRPHYRDDNTSYARSPSPYLFEHTAVVDECSQSQGSLPGGSPIDSQMRPWSSLSAGYGFVDPHSYLFQPSASFCSTNFTSDILTTANSQAHFTVYPASTRPYTPVSNTSETASSYDGLSEM
ncbi:N-terminal fungal transcription regulatory domain-containing protein [Paraphaeosphaeria sporulosa]